MTSPGIETERLRLRGWREDDAESVFRMTSNPVWREHMHGSAETLADAWRTIAVFVGHERLRGYTLWAVEEKETAEWVGWVGPWKPYGWPDLEIGWSIDRSRWGRGYAGEAARAAAAWAHAQLGAASVIHLISPANARSIRVAEKLGARVDGSFTFPSGDRSTADVYRTDLPLRTLRPRPKP